MGAPRLLMLEQRRILCIPFAAIGTELKGLVDERDWVDGFDSFCWPSDAVLGNREFALQVIHKRLRDRVKLLVLLQVRAQTVGRYDAEAGNADERAQDRVDHKSVRQKGFAGIGENGKRVGFALVVRVADGGEGLEWRSHYVLWAASWRFQSFAIVRILFGGRNFLLCLALCTHFCVVLGRCSGTTFIESKEKLTWITHGSLLRKGQ